MAAMDFSGLDRCVDALASSNNTLDASVSTLSQSLSDYPRLLRVLRSRRGYELLSEHEIHLAQLEVRREVEPQIRELISRAESGLEALQRTERGLHEKLETRKRNIALQQHTVATAIAAAASARPPSRQSAPVASSPEVAKLRARLMALQTQRETLLKAAERADEDLRSRRAGLAASGSQA